MKLTENHKNQDTTSEDKQPVSSDGELLTALLASDLAVEVSAEFNGRRSVGFDVPAATANVFGKFRSALISPQDGPVVLIALTVLQLREGWLQPVIRDAALDLIESGEALNAYRSEDGTQRKATHQMLDQLAVLLGKTDVMDDADKEM